MQFKEKFDEISSLFANVAGEKRAKVMLLGGRSAQESQRDSQLPDKEKGKR